MKANGQDLKAHITKLKESVANMPKKKKIIFGGGLGAIVLIAIVITVVLNVTASSQRVLYEGLEADEAAEVYTMLQEIGIEVQRDAQGNITVPAKDYDTALLKVAQEGYSSNSPTYGLFESHSGMTATEAENQQWILYQLQENLQKTLKNLSAVKDAIVNIDVPEQGSYVWEKDTSAGQSSAGVVLTLSEDLTPEQVTAIKNLVASSVPRLEPENVTVMNAETSEELQGNTGEETTSQTAANNLEFEMQVQNQLEENVRRVLAPRYGASGVVAVAKVVIDYDKMMTEELTLQEKEGGGGYVTNFSEQYNLEGEVAAGGIVGEENNTDIPQQAYETDEDGNPLTSYNRDIQYDYGYIKTQIEKGNAVLESASISVMVDEANMTEMRRLELVDLVAKSTGIPEDSISVSPIDPNAQPDEDNNDNQQDTQVVVQIPLWGYILAGAAALLVLLLLILLLVAKSRSKKKKREQEIQQNEIDEQRAQMEQEIAQYKKELSDAAMAATNPKDEAIINEVKDFAKQNPEVTANLLRSWLKEGE